MTRRQSREQAFMILFEKSFHSEAPLDDIISLGLEQTLLKEDDYSLKLAKETWENLEEIDGIIEANSIGWRLSRISKVSLAVLRLAVCEILFFDDVPVSVSINEAVEISKKFAAQEDAPFVNGVLGSVARSLNPGQDSNDQEGEDE
ncbi:MAG: transcription antitermination factor NusB [Clostridiales bacterium]|nr:transcription antitermination factor NusB [Clostridiales bacterium]